MKSGKEELKEAQNQISVALGLLTTDLAEEIIGGSEELGILIRGVKGAMAVLWTSLRAKS